MKKTAPLCIMGILCLTAPCLHAGENAGFGVYAGVQPDAGNLASYPGIQLRPQTNAIAGVMIKIDSDPVFFQLGVYKTFPAAGAEILNNSAGDLKKADIQCVAVPAYFGLILPVKKMGKMYLGTGVALMVASGEVETAKTEKFSSVIAGLGFKTGVQVNAGEHLKFFMEWEYLTAWTRPVATTVSSTGQKDYSADYSGSRYYLGVLYYP